MILRDAFKAWAMAPRNMVLAKNSRNAVEKVLMKKYSDIDLEQITTTFTLSIDMKTVYVNDITECRNEELIAEMKRRRWKGNITMTISIEL